MRDQTNLHALIVDDEPLARHNLRLLLELQKDVEVVGECRNGEEAIEFLRNQKVDLVLLDIQMPEIDGFELVEALGSQHLPSIIFVTAYDEFAIKAFEVAAVDYLLKPVSEDRLQRALDRVRRSAMSGGSESATEVQRLLATRREQAPDSPLRRILIKTRSRIFFLNVEEIDYIEANDYLVSLHVGGRLYAIRESVRDLERSLDPERFIRIHRSFIVNCERIKELRNTVTGGYCMVLKDGTKLRMSRARWKTVQERLKHSLA